MSAPLALALCLASQADTSLALSLDTNAGAGLLPAGGAASPTGDARGQARAGGSIGAQSRVALLNQWRRSGLDLGFDGRAEIQFGEDVLAAASALTPEANPGRQNFLFFGGFGGDLTGRTTLSPRLSLSSGVRGEFQRSDALGFGPGLDAPPGGGAVADPTDPVNQDGELIVLPEGTAFLQSATVRGNVRFDGRVGRRWTWSAGAQVTRSEADALGLQGVDEDGDGEIDSDEVEETSIGDLADITSVSSSGVADWAATRRSFFGLGLSSQFIDLEGDGAELQQSSLVLSAEARFRRIMSQRLELRLSGGAFFNVPLEDLGQQGLGVESTEAFPAARVSLTYIEPPSERLDYDVTFGLSLQPFLNRQLGRVTPELRADINFDARFDEDWGLQVGAFASTAVFADAFLPPQLSDPAPEGEGPPPLIQSSFGGRAQLQRRLTDEWTASFGVTGGARTRQLFSIRGQLETANTAPADQDFDLAFVEVLAQFGLSWRRALAL